MKEYDRLSSALHDWPQTLTTDKLGHWFQRQMVAVSVAPTDSDLTIEEAQWLVAFQRIADADFICRVLADHPSTPLSFVEALMAEAKSVVDDYDAKTVIG